MNVLCSHGPSKRSIGFTLIELLVVVTIIVLLGGITIGLSSMVYRKLEVKRAIKDLTNIQLAIEAFYKEYGHYPPCQKFGHQPTDWNPDRNNDQSDGRSVDGQPVFVPAGQRPQAAGVGLEAYIFAAGTPKKLIGGDAANFYENYPSKAHKWAHYLAEVPLGDYSAGTVTQKMPDIGDVVFDFFGFVVVDPWTDRTTGGMFAQQAVGYFYDSPGPDYQTYNLGYRLPNGETHWIVKQGEVHSYESR